MPPDPPSIDMLCMPVSFLHTIYIISKIQGHVGHLGPGINIGLVTPLLQIQFVGFTYEIIKTQHFKITNQEILGCYSMAYR